MPTPGTPPRQAGSPSARGGPVVVGSVAWHHTSARQRYFFTAENAENGELLWALLSSSPVVFVPFHCFLTFSAFSAASAVKSRVVVLA